MRLIRIFYANAKRVRCGLNAQQILRAYGLKYAYRGCMGRLPIMLVCSGVDHTMRLNDIQISVIREEVQRHFGGNARALLFGSRVQDDALGGDIDLYVETEGSAEETLVRELKLYAVLQRRLGEQRIDLVVHRAGSPLRSIDREAQDTGIAL